MRWRRAFASVGLAGALLLLLAGPASAQAGGGSGVQKSDLLTLAQQVNLLWIVIGAVLVVFMQAGFALVETGFCRAKHAAHVVSTNFAIFGLGFVAFFLVGYAFMFGGYSYVLEGADFGYKAAIGGPLLSAGNWVFLWKGGFALGGIGKAGGAAVLGFFLYMVAFMDTTATIPTGSMAERWKWKSFILWGLFCGGLYYPLFGAFTWGGGWLSQLGNNAHLGLGYVDFAGSGVVHAMGGMAALSGAMVLGPRIGKYVGGKSVTLAGHHIPMAMLGTFILLFGWFGFNAASTLAATDIQFATVATNTAIAGAFGATVGMLWIMMRAGKPDPGMMANGMLAGLVAITAPCAFVEPWAAALIGTLAAVIVIEAIGFIDNRLKVDDPVGAISVHGVGGLFGVLSVGIFANGKYGAGWNLTKGVEGGVTGILYGGTGAEQLIVQAIGVLTIIVVGFGLSYAFWKITNALMKGGIRPAADVELKGMDIPEMGVLAYPEFEGSSPVSANGGGVPAEALTK